ncbi:hypothetical protein U1Q18_015540 [Sarracenia purpurea var. burkii]
MKGSTWVAILPIPDKASGKLVGAGLLGMYFPGRSTYHLAMNIKAARKDELLRRMSLKTLNFGILFDKGSPPRDFEQED